MNLTPDQVAALKALLQAREKTIAQMVLDNMFLASLIKGRKPREDMQPSDALAQEIARVFNQGEST